MTRRLLTFGAALALLAAACGAPEAVPVDYGEGERFVPLVVDSQDQVGQGAAIAVGADGVSYISYFGFPAEVPEGEIAIPRPIGSAFLPGVLLTSVDADGLITKGAVQQTKPASEPAGITPPFRPETVEDLDLSAGNANGSAVAVGEDGSVHVAWVAGDGVYYAKAVAGSDAAVSAVYEYEGGIALAGPVGRPGITLDGAGAPWIAFGVNDSEGLREVVATPSGTEWDVQDVAPLTPCNGCPQPLPSGIAVVGDAPVVVFGDPGADAVVSATLYGNEWATTTVETGALGAGLSLAAGGDAAHASYYDGAGTLHVASWDGSAWSVAEAAAAPASADAPTSGLGAPASDVAVAGDGTVWVTWEDDGVHIARADGETFTEVETTSTGDGTGPSLAVTSEGAVLLAWYRASSMDLLFGVWGDPQEVLVALPSPAPTISLAPEPAAECGADGKLALDIVALNVAFDLNCLVAPAGEPFEINFDNQDAGIPHNVAIYTDSSAATSLFVGETFNGVDQRAYAVDPLDAGTYFFRCDVHPTTMTGTLAAIEGAK
ncbi:MAG TPA: cupredoxin domain-containing protein [Actinomycetota bacterium]